MTMPEWWTERRFGILVEASAATVPAWAPIGENASWYRSHIGDGVAEVVVHQSPLVEALAHHRDRWGHVEHYDDFVPLLRFDRFDAEEWADLVRDAGAGYAVHVAKHHDGWAWWDAPGGLKRMTEHGPQRNVVAEFAAACERNDIVFGAAYSLLDWGDDRYPTEQYVDEVLHPQVLDLVGRYGATLLRGDGEWAHDAGHWQTAALMRAVREIEPEVVIDNRWWASATDVPDGAPEIVTTFDHDLPAEILARPWELRRGVGLSGGHNRAEGPEHQMTGVDIVDLLTEVIAKGGNLLLTIGPTAEGTIPDIQAAPLRDAGTWIRRHRSTLASARPWSAWGDDSVRYLSLGDDVVAIDIAGMGRFPAFDARSCAVTSVSLLSGTHDTPVGWEQTDDALLVAPPSDDGDGDRMGIALYRISSAPAEPTYQLFPTLAPAPTPLGPLLADAKPGTIVQLGEGEYDGPADVPPGVTLRGFGPLRTIISTPRDAPKTIAAPRPTLTLGRDARVEHLTITSGAPIDRRFAPPLVELAEPGASMLGVTVAGSLRVGADDVLIQAVTAQSVRALDVERVHVSRCHFTGNHADVGVDIRGGSGHQVESNQFANHLCGVRLDATAGAVVRGNTIKARWWGVHLRTTEATRVHGNRFAHTMRAVDVDGGTEATVGGNAVVDADSGCIVQGGASRCEVYGNHWDRCRIGLLLWGDVAPRHQDNVTSDLRDEGAALVVGP